MQSDNIRADFLNISCNSTVIETIETCFRRAGITIAKLTVSATDLANVIPTEQERNSGCIFVVWVAKLLLWQCIRAVCCVI